MIKLINTVSNTVLANEIIPLNVKYNTNNNISFSGNSVTINKAGYYKISSIFNITATGTTTNVTLYANGIAIPETAITITSVVGDNYEIVIDDIERVIRQYNNLDNVTLTFVTTTGGTFTNANVSVVEIR